MIPFTCLLRKSSSMTIQLQLEQKNSMYISLVLISAIMLVLTPRLMHALRAAQIFLFFFPLLFSLFFGQTTSMEKLPFLQVFALRWSILRLCTQASLLSHVFASPIAYLFTSLHLTDSILHALPLRGQHTIAPQTRNCNPSRPASIEKSNHG